MTLFKGLYTRAQEMSAEQVLNTNNLTSKLLEKEESLKEAWRKNPRALFTKAMQTNDNYVEAYLRHKFC